MKVRVKDENGEVKEVEIRANKMLLEELEEAGYDIPYACKI
jgi:ferredoxin